MRAMGPSGCVGSYGWRRIRAELADAYGQQVNKKLIRSIMADQGISGLPARRKAKPAPLIEPPPKTSSSASSPATGPISSG